MDTNTIALEVKDLCIKYRGLKSYSIKRNLFHPITGPAEEFQALKNVSFSLSKGRILGVVGRNGSGKSTLLKALAGIFAPDSGYIDLKGNSISLLSIGVGFQKELTGRENMLLAGMLLGFSESEVREKMPDIISFAEIGDFIDAPVRTYSSGMYSKLAFSITAILETDIMLIDEVLSVGDAKFKKKSFNKMKQLIADENHTVIIVSHSPDTLANLCDEVLWLHEGRIKMYTDTQRVLSAYKNFMN